MSAGPGVAALLAVAQVAFGGRQSAFESAGEPAARIQSLAWVLAAVATLVTLLVVGAMLVAVFRRRPPAEQRTAVLEHDARERRAARVVATAVGATILTLFLFLAVDFATGRAMASPPDPEDPLRIKVTGHQWWWQVEYADPVPSRVLTTANEIHVPVGRTVVLELESRDVIHSLWIPALDGKKDLVPGDKAVSWFRATAPGVYRGQCAEFCGHQHAKMALTVVVEPPERFAAWYAAQLQPARPPADSAARAGEQVFLTKGCVMCHAIQGTPAGSRVGPDLTHVASRLELAAGAIPNTRGHLAGWITDPQRIKPGVRMPPNQLSPHELHALLAYLESLR